MSKKLTKLSSKSRLKTKKLDNSDEDFQSVITEERPKQPKLEILETTENSSLAENLNFLPPCPFCGKSFNAAQELTRISHLKSCGNQLGLDTNQLLKIKQLEDRQADEWRALNLPKVANASGLKNTSKTLSKTRRNATQFQATGDPHLDMALALSASMTSSETKQEVKENKCWLPQPPPIAKGKSKAKTTLQVRTDDERNKQITEAVMTIIAASPKKIESQKLYTFQKSKLNLCSSCHWWSAANLIGDLNFYLDLIKPYLKTESRQKPVKNDEIPTEKSSNDCGFDQNLAQDWLKLLESGDKADVIIYVRGEEMIKAHQLVLFSRCRNLLEHVIEEQGNDMKILSMPEVSKNVMVSFLKYLYGGQVYLVLEDEQDLEDAKHLAKLCPQLEHWRTSITDQSLRGFIEESEEESITDDSKLIASQNLSNLLNILEENDADNDQVPDDQEWDDVCEFLSQQSKEKSGYESPDLFEDSDPEELEVNEKQTKRKSSIEAQNESKRSRIDLEQEMTSFNETCWQNCSVYSRKNDSAEPSVLNDLTLEDSKKSPMNLGDSSLVEPLQSALESENVEVEKSMTIESPKVQLKTPISSSQLMPNYEQMLSPALRLELRRFGLKVIPRQKAVPLLQHIYEETHPEEMNARRKVDFEEQDLSLSQESTEEEVMEESILNEPISQANADESLHQKLLSFIRAKADLHRQVLMYEPLWLEDLFQQFKAEHPAEKNMKINQLQEMLDNECITFRTRARHDKNVKRNKK